MQSCIYGVDLNPLAVELAKLSLWLTTAAKDRPLSFLDHHLRPGNALVGARLEELQRANRTIAPKKKKTVKADPSAADGAQLALIDAGALQQNIGFAVGSMEKIEGSASDAAAQVKAQEVLYTEMRRNLLGKYGRWANLVTAAHFGVEVSSDLWTPLSDYATGRTISTLPQIARYLDDAETIARRDRFFHWELEFPEIYFDHDGQPLGEQAGFDVVIGNPPYVRQEELARFKPFYQRRYESVFHGAADLFVYFFARGLRQLRGNGLFSYICSNSWLQTNSAMPLRNALRDGSTIHSLIDLGNNRTFAEAPDVCPSIIVIENRLADANHRMMTVSFHRGEAPMLTSDVLASKAIYVRQSDQPESGWQLEADTGRELFVKLLARGEPLGEVAKRRLLYGVKTGLNDAFIVSQETRDRLIAADFTNAEFIKPIIRGEDLRPWYQENEGRWLILFPSGWTVKTFGSKVNEPKLSEEDAWERLCSCHPALAAYLLPFADAARARQDKGAYWWELRACRYYDDFAKPKLFWPDIAKIPRFSYDSEGKFINDKGYIIPVDDYALLGYLQSRVAWACISRLCLHNKFRAGLWEYHMKTQFVSRLPIPTMNEYEREAVGRLAKTITEQARARYDLHEKTRLRIVSDLGVPGIGLNQKLTAWWTLDFTAFRRELQKVFKRDIPLKERDEWEEWLGARKAEHWARTSAIVGLETELNGRVYALFGLSPDEIALIEASTKYAYGEV